MPTISMLLRTRRLTPILLFGLGLALLGVEHPGAVRLSISIAMLYMAFWGAVVSRFRESRKLRALRFTVCTLAGVFGVAVFEVPALLGIVDYRVLFAAPSLPWQRPGNRPDPDLIHIKQGNRRVRESFSGNDVHRLRDAGTSPIYRSDRRYDRDGFRNLRDLDKADVMVLGDSFIEGAHVTDEQLITARLAVELGGQKSVINLGQAGYGPEQELHVLRRFGIPRRPSVCIWTFYEGNDLADIDDYEPQRVKLAECLRTGRGLIPSFADRCFTANVLGFLLRRWIDPAPRLPASRYRGWFTDDRGSRVPLYFASGDYRREAAGSRSPFSSKSLDRLQEILVEAHALCRDQGIKLVLMFIPSKLRVYRESCVFEDGSVCVKWPVDELPRAIGRMVAETSPDFDFLDLTPRFQAEAVQGDLLYLPDDTHWSAAGHRSAALAIAERLTE